MGMGISARGIFDWEQVLANKDASPFLCCFVVVVAVVVVVMVVAVAVD